MSLAFFAIGDWGKNYDRFNIETTIESPQMRVANAMYKNMTNESFVVSIGDMFYTRKDKELDEKSLKEIDNKLSHLHKRSNNSHNIQLPNRIKQGNKLQSEKIRLTKNKQRRNNNKEQTIESILISKDNQRINSKVTELYNKIWYNYYNELNLDWFGVLGNHEYNYGDEYTNSILSCSTGPWDNNKSFKILKTTYSKIVETTLIIFINTADLIRKFEGKKKKNENEKKKEQIKEQLFMTTLFAIIKECISNDTCENIVIVGHHPIISHRHKDKKAGHDIIQRLFRYIVGLLEINNILPKLIGYICGHEHNYQVIDITCQGIEPNKKTTFKQIITGSGGEDTDPILNCKDQDNCHQIINSNINTIKGNNNYKSLYNSNVPSDFTYNVIDLQTGHGCAKIEIKGNELTSTFIEEEPLNENKRLEIQERLHSKNRVNKLANQLKKLPPLDIGYN